MILAQPDTGGTPGAQNSTYASNIGPTIDQVTHDPPVPPSNTPVTVSGRISDPDGIGTVQLRYAIAGGAFQTVVMAETGTFGVWSGQIPGQSSAIKV